MELDKKRQKDDIQRCIDSMEEECNKLGVGLFESNFDDEGLRGEIHLIPMTRSGMAMPPHNAVTSCECKPRLLRENPVRIYAHNKIVG